MQNVTAEEWRLLLRLLSQRLEINAIESSLKNANVLTDAQTKEIRAQARDTAMAWSSRDSDDVRSSSEYAHLQTPRCSCHRYHHKNEPRLGHERRWAMAAPSAIRATVVESPSEDAPCAPYPHRQ